MNNVFQFSDMSAKRKIRNIIKTRLSRFYQNGVMTLVNTVCGDLFICYDCYNILLGHILLTVFHIGIFVIFFFLQSIILVYFILNIVSILFISQMKTRKSDVFKTKLYSQY